ncbi:hypothetical protein M404DRAFT_992775, partial [Pisolithus tinctorius Marx 270]
MIYRQKALDEYYKVPEKREANNGRSGCGETASNDEGECSEHAEKETEGIRLGRPKIFAKMSKSASNHENEHISTMSARNLTKE